MRIYLKITVAVIACIVGLTVCKCLFIIASANAHGVHSQPKAQSNRAVFITEIELARDDGAGRGGQAVKSFRRTDNPLHCLVTLSRAGEATKVQFVWTVLDAGGKRDEVLATTEVVTKPNEIVADGQLRLPREWPAGRYRVRATANNRSTKSLDFVIE